MKYKYTGTEQQLFERGFNVFSEDFPYESGGYPLLGRAQRDNIEIFTSVVDPQEKINWINKEKDITFAYSHLENMPKKHYIELNVVYDNYDQNELQTPYAIQDLINDGLIEIIEGEDNER